VEKGKPQKISEKVTIYPFELIYQNKSRSFYLLEETECDKWVTTIKKAMGYSNIEDFYTFGNVLGKGKFGLVRGGVHKKDGTSVAIKCVAKS
jgi:serine/threonine protein kinase